MRIGIISDIHTDVQSLQRALEEMQPVDRVLCAGDMVSQYRFSNQVFDIIRNWPILAVMGNHEDVILTSAGEPLRSSGTISPENLRMLERLPHLLEMEIDGKHLMMLHSSPLDPRNNGFFPLSHSANSLPESKADVLVVGNTHWPVITQVGQTLLINPGSLGEPRDPDHPRRRTYAVLDTLTWEASIGFFEQPFQSV